MKAPAQLGGQQLLLRAAGDVDFEGIKDRSELKSGMELKVIYLEPIKGEAPLGFDITVLEAGGPHIWSQRGSR
jgi:hypothetical protein